MSLSRLVLVVAALLLAAAPASAGEQTFDTDPESEALALEAQQVLNEHCAEAAAGGATSAAESVAAVSDVWVRVSSRVESGNKIYLLYWRGVLGQCLSQEERALKDLKAFVTARQGSELWAGLLSDAKMRIRRLEQRLGGQGAPTVDPLKPLGIGVGTALAGGAAVTGIASALRWRSALQHAQSMYLKRPTDEEAFLADHQEGQLYAEASVILLGVSISCVIGSVVSFAAAGRTGASRLAKQAGPPVLVATPAGAAVLWQGQW